MSFKCVSPESVGLPSCKVINFLNDATANGIELHSFMFLRHGRVFAKGFFNPYQENVPHIMFSFTKSLTSTAIGFAWQEGKLSLDEKLVDIFKHKLPQTISNNLASCTIFDLLTMGCGHGTELPLLGLDTKDWVKAFLAHPFEHKPGTKFMYNTAGTNMLVKVLYEKTGMNLIEYLKPRLFTPLEMGEIKCYKLPDGTDLGGAGSFLTTESMAKFIQFVANFGSWNGKELLKKEWFELATEKQIDNAPENPKDANQHWSSGYGFQFWRCALKNTFRADGAFGQYGIVCKDEDAVFVLTSSSTNMHTIIDLLNKHIITQFKNPVEENPCDKAILDYTCKNLSLPSLLSQRCYESMEKYGGKVYAPTKPLQGSWAELIAGAGVSGRYAFLGIAPTNKTDYIKSIKFEFNQNEALIITDYGNRVEKMPISMTSRFGIFEAEGKSFGAVGTWTQPNIYTFNTRCISAASGTVFSARFTTDGMVLSASPTIPLLGGLADEKLEDINFKEVI